MVGTDIGPYRVLAKLGEGGMGAVYRARDTQLGRDVALKILPDVFANDRERLARFEREARTLASLNHPNIAAIYGVVSGDTPDVQALVMELVPGQDLAQTISRGPIPSEDAIAIARQIIDALEAAHEAGVIHRDLKPANIRVRDDGAVKLLDFGLAKALDPASMSEASAASTVTSPAATMHGAILGTAAYMSPEQAKGKPVDKRADIWAFGVVLYELLTGRRLFHAETVTETLAAVLRQDVDLSTLPSETPLGLRQLIARCLERDPRRRLRDIGDARLEIEGASRSADATVARTASSSSRAMRMVPWALATLLGVALIVALGWRPRSAPATALPAGRFLFPIPANTQMLGSAFAPNGQALAFVLRAKGVDRVWIRELAHLEWRELPDTDGAQTVFWSSNSRSIGFFADGKLKTLDLVTGVLTPRCELPAAAYPPAAWAPDDTILYSGGKGVRVCGNDRQVTALASGDQAHWSPSFLPDGRRFIYLAVTKNSSEIRYASIDPAGPSGVIGPSESQAIYNRGYLLFRRSGLLLAQRIDAASLTLQGDPFKVLDEYVPAYVQTREANFRVSNDGAMLFTSRDEPAAQLTWFDRDGNPLKSVGPAGAFTNLNLSPDGKQLAVSHSVRRGQSPDIWVFDLERGSLQPLTRTPTASEYDPAFSPDGRTIIFNSNRQGPFALFQRAADGSGQDQLVIDGTSGNVTTPEFLPNPKELAILYTSGGRDLVRVNLDTAHSTTPWLTSPARTSQPAISPDGRFVAYQTDASGKMQVVLRPMSGGAVVPVSVDGGNSPRWGGDGRELFFLAPDGSMMAAKIDLAIPRVLSLARLFGTRLTGDGHPYVVTRDGQRFLFAVRPEGQDVTSFITDWLALPRQAPK
ncbi:MAG TPA: protein kinase [Vicinamibacterales bacterium]|nr:protein kinase [Vicinamibacterales bacterium]